MRKTSRLERLCWAKLVNDDWEAMVPADAGWWYNERASLSIFAGAVWKQSRPEGCPIH